MKKALQTLAAAKSELIHRKAKPLLDALEQHGGEKATAKIDPKHAAASRMQQLTNSTLSELDIKLASKNLQNYPSQSDGAFGFYKRGTKKTENKRGVKVYENESIVATARYEVLGKDGRGLSNYNAGNSHNLLEKIVENSKLLPHVFACGRDYFQIAEVPKSWDIDKSYFDVVADLYGFSDWVTMHIHLCGEMHELHGMSSMRFIGDDIVPYGNSLPAFCRGAGYLFTFKKGNPTRFDTSGQLSDLPGMTKLSKEAFDKKHGPVVFSVEKVGDETFGTKRCRIFGDVREEIGRKFKKKGKQEELKKRHMPSAVGGEKLFETPHGTYKVRRLILD